MISKISIISAVSTICLALAATNCSAGNWRDRVSDAEEVTSGDIAAEVTFGRNIAAKILGRYKPYDNPALIKYVNLVGASLAMNTNRPELEFHLMVLDTDEINAYAAPGGYIFITKGALRYMKDESELAGVLAHEVGHITEKHVVKQLKIKGSDDGSDLAKLIGGGSAATRAAFSQAVDKGLEMIFKDEYKKEDELQADKSSVDITALTGYDPSGLARYLGRIKPIKEKIPLPVNDDHPTFDLRIKQINDIIKQDGIKTDALAKKNKRFAEAIKNLN